jgi:hypothetical protein
MKDLEKELDDLYIRADITNEVSQIVNSELKNNEKYLNSSVIQGLKISKHWFRSFMKNFGYMYGLRRNVGSTTGVDCGCHALIIAENISRRCLNFDFQTKKINSYREKIAYEIIAGKLFEQKLCEDFLKQINCTRLIE